MKSYGAAITWGMGSFTGPITGDAQSFNYTDALAEYLSPAQDGEHAAMVLHGRKGDISFESLISADTDNIPDISQGARLAISAIASGLILVRSVTESWRDRQSKSVSFQASHYPEISNASGDEPGALDGFLPEQSSISIRPAGRVIWSTVGLSHAAGKIRAFSVTQNLQIAEEHGEDGEYCGVATHSYERQIILEILSTGSKPAVDTTLAVTGAPDHAAGYAITSSDEIHRLRVGKLYRVEAKWIPAMAA